MEIKQKIALKPRVKKMLADTITPVGLYLQLRDKYQNAILLESSDYHGNDNSLSFIAMEPVALFSLKDQVLTTQVPNASPQTINLQEAGISAMSALKSFQETFESTAKIDKKIPQGIFGYMGYDAIQYFDSPDISQTPASPYDIPDIHYRLYRYQIVIDHFKNELYLVDNFSEDEGSRLDELQATVYNKNFPTYQFKVKGEEQSNYDHDTFLDIIRKGQQHCFQGDVFQMVLSRRFSSEFEGDEFNVYRALRSVNPSPYLFYFDYGNFKVFGSSPEAQLVVRRGKASIRPIAGTFKRTGDDYADRKLAEKLAEDVKENAEHVMLVDLARNDLSRHGKEVKVANFKEIQFYSHVIHLVSKVNAQLYDKGDMLQVAADTFPAGTLSGAPKYKALELIHKYETSRRGFYGGAIGFIGFDGSFNHAIMIRSMLSRKNTLYYQAGAGIVAKSVPESELEEVNNKLAALRQALQTASQIN